jgi:hypothetical protein
VPSSSQAAHLLENLWRGSVWPDEDDPEAMQRWAPFTLQWPGLAAPEPTPLTPAEPQHALDVVLPRIRVAYGVAPEARIALVAADRRREPSSKHGGLPGHPRSARISFRRRALVSMWERTSAAARPGSPERMPARMASCSASSAAGFSYSRSSTESTIR